MIPRDDGRTATDTGRPLLTLRVSWDSGRTWGPQKVIRSTENLTPMLSSAWPLCQGPKCGGSTRA